MSECPADKGGLEVFHLYCQPTETWNHLGDIQCGGKGATRWQVQSRGEDLS